MSTLRQATAAAALGELKRPEPGAVSRYYRFDSDFVGFAGHFPGRPILPALVQILAGVTLAEAWLGRSLALTAIQHAKFLRPLSPGQQVLVQCRERQGDGERRCEVRIGVEGRLVSSFILTLADRESEL